MAIVLPVIVLTLGFAIDYAYASYVNQRLSRALDDAVLGSVSQTAATAMGGYANTQSLTSYGSALFSENISQINPGSGSLNLSVTPDGIGGAIASGTYNYAVPTFFSTVLGASSIPVASNAKAAAKPLTYANYYILVDTSQSMGLASTAADMQNLYDRVVLYKNGLNGSPDGCVFGCHVKGPKQTYTNEYLAHSISPPITLRIDAAITAIQGIINTASATTGTQKNISFGLYTIQYNDVDQSFLKMISPPSNDYTTLSNLATQIDLGPNIAGGTGDTDFVNELATFNGLLLPNGNGASAVSPLNYVFLITDGVTDVYGLGCTYTHCTGVLDSAKCTPLKTKATVGVIYTTYLPIYNQNIKANGLFNDYNKLVVPFATQIVPALQACATSSDYYFEATDGPALNASMQALFAKTLPTNAHLVQ